MKDSWRVFVRDVRRIIAVPRSLIIVVGILVTPALYTWLNILAFWNPYTATANLPIAVVSNDKGTDSELTDQIVVGDLIVEQLEKNDQLGWRFTDEATAEEMVKAGDVYAAFVIPDSFSEDLVKIFAGERRQPTIEYQVNEKKGAIAPKITDAGASQLDMQITSTFRGEVGKAIVQALRDSGLEIEANVNDAEGTTLNTLGGIDENLAVAKQSLGSASRGLDASVQSLNEVRDTLKAADAALVDVSASLQDTQTVLGSIVTEAQDFTTVASEATIKAQNALNQSAATAKTATSEALAKITEMESQLQSGMQRADDSLATVRKQIQTLQQDPQTAKLAEKLNSQLDDLQALLDKVEATGDEAGKTTQELKELTQAFDDALQAAQGVVDASREQSSQALRTLSAQVTELSARLGGVKSTVESTRVTLTQVPPLVDGLEAQLRSTQGVMTQAQGNLNDLSDNSRIAQTEVAALATALRDGPLGKVVALDADNIGHYLASPVEFDQKTVYPMNSYGSGMAAMFINLSLWIGSLILVIIFRVEVDTEGFEWLRLRSAYFGRFMLSGILSVGQGLIVSVGSLLLGVQTANAPAFIATAMIISPCYFGIVYALAAALSHVGRALAILLVVLQIPGASGIYPIELMPGFFRGLAPLLPFSYGIDAMRETIGGFYDDKYWHTILVLVFMSVSMLILGLIGRRQLGYLTQLFYDDLERTELVINEGVQLQGIPYRLSNIIALLSNRKEFSTRITLRQERFNSHYHALINGLTVVGIVGLVAFGIISHLTSFSKAGLLGLVAIWGLVIFGALMAVVALKSSIERAERLSHLSEDELFARLALRKAPAKSENLELPDTKNQDPKDPANPDAPQPEPEPDQPAETPQDETEPPEQPDEPENAPGKTIEIEVGQ